MIYLKYHQVYFNKKSTSNVLNNNSQLETHFQVQIIL